MDLYPTNINEFDKYFPEWRNHSIHNQELLPALSVSASNWTTLHLEALRVIARKPQNLTSLDPYITEASAIVTQNRPLDLLLSVLSGSRELLVPQHLLIDPAGPLFTFYNSLAIVLQRPAPAPPPISSLDTVKNVGHRPSTSLPEGYMTAEELSSEGTYPTSDQFDSSSYRASSQISTGSSAAEERIKDEVATAEMAIAFLTGILSLSRLHSGRPSDSRQDMHNLLEFTPVPTHFTVDMATFSFAAIDDGGLVLCGFDQDGRWGVINNLRYCAVECKRRVYERTQVGPLAQHTADMISQIDARMRAASIHYDMAEWDKGRVQVIDRTVFLLCFHQTKFMVKAATFDTDYLRMIFHKPSWDAVVRSSPPVHGGEYGSRIEGDTNSRFLTIDSSIEQDLSTVNGRVVACTLVLAVVAYVNDRHVSILE